MLGLRSGEWRAAVATGLAYLAAASLALAYTRFGGSVACFWVAGAVLLARLSTVPSRQWGAVLLCCGAAHFVAVAWLGIGPLGAIPMTLICLGEAAVAALVLQRIRRGRDTALDSVAQVGAIVLSAGLVAPALAAVPAAAVISATAGTPFARDWLDWLIGHSLGALTFWPVLTPVFSGEARRWWQDARRRQLVEAGALMLVVAAVATLVFSRADRALLFLPAVPVMLATFRVGRLGAAGAVVVIALVGGVFGFLGAGPLPMGGPETVEQARLFQIFLAAIVLTALPAATELRRQRLLFDRLRDSEARYRLLAENSSDIVLSASMDGTIGYASPSATQLGGYSPEELVGRPALSLVHREDRGLVAAAFRRVVADPDAAVAVEYRIATAWGEERWFESRSRGVRGADGRMSGTVSAIRDITQRKALETELALAAATDPLTSLPNRRAFDAALEKLLADGRRGCVAIFDLDHFKAVNDRFGHDGGDRVLTAFAAAARGALRDGDLVARLGGEEFGVLLPGASREQARAACERLRAAADAPVRLPGGTVRITASAGLAQIVPGLSAADLLRAADEALYRAKTAGRDRLSLAA